MSSPKVMLKQSSGVDMLSISIAGPTGLLNGIGSVKVEPVAEVSCEASPLGEFKEPFWAEWVFDSPLFPTLPPVRDSRSSLVTSFG